MKKINWILFCFVLSTSMSLNLFAMAIKNEPGEDSNLTLIKRTKSRANSVGTKRTAARSFAEADRRFALGNKVTQPSSNVRNSAKKRPEKRQRLRDVKQEIIIPDDGKVTAAVSVIDLRDRRVTNPRVLLRSGPRLRGTNWVKSSRNDEITEFQADDAPNPVVVISDEEEIEEPIFDEKPVLAPDDISFASQHGVKHGESMAAAWNHLDSDELSAHVSIEKENHHEVVPTQPDVGVWLSTGSQFKDEIEDVDEKAAEEEEDEIEDEEDRITNSQGSQSPVFNLYDDGDGEDNI